MNAYVLKGDYLLDASKVRNYPCSMRKIIGGAIALFFAIIAMAFTYWNALETALSKLRSKGSVGVFIADLIVSPAIQLSLILVALVFFFLAFRELRVTRKTVASSMTDEKKGDSTDDSKEASRRSISQTMIGSPGGLQAGRDIKNISEQKR